MADNPYGLGPGAAMADTLQNILASKRAEQRQAMIDEISKSNALANQRNIDSEIATRADNAQTNKLNRQSMVDERAQKIAQSKQAQDRLNDLSGWASEQWSDDPTIQQANEFMSNFPEKAPGIQEELLKRAMAKDKEPKMVPGYSRGPKGELIPMNKPMPKGAAGPPEPYMVKEGTNPDNLPNPPQPTAAMFPNYQFKDEIDPKTQQPTGRVIALDSKSGKAIRVIAPEGTDGIGLHPPSKSNDVFSKALTAYLHAPKGPDAVSQQQRKALGEVTISAIPNPEDQQAVRSILGDKNASAMKAEDLVSSGALEPSLTDPDHVNRVVKYLKAIRAF